jgi:hypothetical protein
MALTITNALRTAACNSIIVLVDAGTLNPNGYVNIYSSPRPSGPEVDPSPAVRLATVPLANPAFGAAINGEAIASGMGLTGIPIEATGTATWYRVFDRDNRPLWDGSITLTGAGGDMQFNDVAFVLNGRVVLNSFKAVMPQ